MNVVDFSLIFVTWTQYDTIN